MKHPNDMTHEELRELVSDMSGMALDLAQHLDFTLNALKVQYRKEAYERAIGMAWQICYAWDHEREHGNFEIAVFGEGGLVVHRGGMGEMMDGWNAPVATIAEDYTFTEFETALQEVEGGMVSDEDIEGAEKALKFWREAVRDKRSRDHVEVKVKTLEKALWRMEIITDHMKNAKKLIHVIRGELDSLKLPEPKPRTTPEITGATDVAAAEFPRLDGGADAP